MVADFRPDANYVELCEYLRSTISSPVLAELKYIIYSFRLFLLSFKFEVLLMKFVVRLFDRICYSRHLFPHQIQIMIPPDPIYHSKPQSSFMLDTQGRIAEDHIDLPSLRNHYGYKAKSSMVIDDVELFVLTSFCAMTFSLCLRCVL